MSYEAPKCRIGTVLHCEYFGDVKVVGFTDTACRWPVCEPNTSHDWLRPGPVPILTGDLIRAVCVETEAFVRKNWGVTKWYVDHWRMKLAGLNPSENVSRNRIWAALKVKLADPAFRKKYGIE